MADMKERDNTIKPQVAAASAPADQFDRDLHPNTMAGQNIGSAGEHSEKGPRTAKDVKQVHALFNDWSDADLDQVPVVQAGTRLKQDATYLDLSSGTPREFTATGGMSAERGQCLIAKSEVPYQLWNRLRGIHDLDRTGVAEDKSGRVH
jgi:hypothetical protein